MGWTEPSISDFKAFFSRDFVYGDGTNTVQDGDITRAFTVGGVNFNAFLWVNQTEYSTAYLYASAHFLVLNLQNAGGLSAINRGLGVTNKGGGAIETKSVGNVSVGYAVPDWVRQSPIFSPFMSTGYGQLFAQLAWPRTVGNIAVVGGTFNPGLAGLPPSLVITTQSLPNGTHSVAYSQQLFSIGGVSPINWSLQTGALPTGLTLSAGGILGGTPGSGTAGTYNFRVVAVDRQQVAAGQNLTLVIS